MQVMQMQELGLIGLCIQIMPSKPNLEFGVPSQYSYMTVCSHPLLYCTLINWKYSENSVQQHFDAPPLWAIFPLQVWNCNLHQRSRNRVHTQASVWFKMHSDLQSRSRCWKELGFAHKEDAAKNWSLHGTRFTYLYISVRRGVISCRRRPCSIR
jgi:hypothetical protein